MRVFLSFLGLGAAKRENNQITDASYKETSYTLGGRPAGSPTPYVQMAILEHLVGMKQPPEKILLAMTPDSRQWHWEREDRLRDALLSKRQAWQLPEAEPLAMSDDLQVDTQWSTFEMILDQIPEKSSLYIDLTHGFRAVPILFSTAINFLIQTRKVELCGAYYGAYEQGKPGPFPIVDMTDFYVVNRWADAVQRLVEDANPSPLAQLSSSSSTLRLQNLGDPGLTESLERLSATLKNASSLHVAEHVHDVLSHVKRLENGASPSSRILMNMLTEKFSQLAFQDNLRHFSADWYRTQLKMAEVLIDHGLLMQGLTILRELVVSWGEELALREANNEENPGRKAYLARGRKPRDFKEGWIKQARIRVAEPFFARLHMDPKDWQPGRGDHDPDGTILRGLMDGFFEKHFAADNQHGSFQFLNDLGKLRNSFNHAWTGKTNKAQDHVQILAACKGHRAQVQEWTERYLTAKILGQGT
jgi:CRISPR-associated DxTHG motif protein